MDKLTILVVGGGGREHALAWKLAQSPQVGQIYVAPGNGGTAGLGANVPIAHNDVAGLVAFAAEQGVDLTVVGPEGPLALGLVDALQGAGRLAFGPRQAAARLESSKAFAKTFMYDHHIPTASYASFSQLEPARHHLARIRSQVEAEGIVIKASGLAAGKGVLVCNGMAEAEGALRQILVDGAFGAAGDEVLIEQRLRGPEMSLLAFCDGRTAVPLVPARDHKRAYDGDRGPNTGGMGVYAPPLEADDNLVQQVMDAAIHPVVRGMAARGTPYAGVLYAGLMLTPDGPRVLEYNCRFGDPETQVILPLLQGDLAGIMMDCAAGRLRPETVVHRSGYAAAVVMAAPGYPGDYPRGLPISGLDQVPDGVLVFHAGTRQEGKRLVTSGGRVLAIAALGPDLETAADRAYAGVASIQFPGAHYRTDIARSR